MKWIKTHREFGNRDYVNDEGVVECFEKYEAYSYNGRHGLCRKVELQEVSLPETQFTQVEDTWRDGNRCYARIRGERIYDKILRRKPGLYLQLQLDNKVLAADWKEV